MWALWRGTKYTIRGEGRGFPQVRAVVSLVNLNLPVVYRSTKNVQTMLQPTCCLVCADPREWLSACHSFESHLGAPTYPSIPQSVVSHEMCPDSLLFRCFHFKLTFESIKEFGSMSCSVVIWTFLYQSTCFNFET
jgi:hypothetical protein